MSGGHCTESRLTPGDREQRPGGGEAAPRAPRAVTLGKGRRRPRAKPGGRGGALAPRVAGPRACRAPPAGMALLRAGREPTLTRPLGALASPTPTVFSATGVPGSSGTTLSLSWLSRCTGTGPAAWRAPRKRLPRPGSGGSADAATLGAPPPCALWGGPCLRNLESPESPARVRAPPPQRWLSRLWAPRAAGQGPPVPPAGTPACIKRLVKARPWGEGGKKEFTIGARGTVSPTPQR